MQTFVSWGWEGGEFKIQYTETREDPCEATDKTERELTGQRVNTANPIEYKIPSVLPNGFGTRRRVEMQKEAGSNQQDPEM